MPFNVPIPRCTHQNWLSDLYLERRYLSGIVFLLYLLTRWLFVEMDAHIFGNPLPSITFGVDTISRKSIHYCGAIVCIIKSDFLSLQDVCVETFSFICCAPLPPSTHYSIISHNSTQSSCQDSSDRKVSHSNIFKWFIWAIKIQFAKRTRMIDNVVVCCWKLGQGEINWPVGLCVQ